MSSPPVGSCHGFDVRSQLTLRLARDAMGSSQWGELNIEQATNDPVEPASAPVRAWVPTPEKPFSARLHRLQDGFGLWIEGLGVYRTLPAKALVMVPSGVSAPRWESRLWGLPTVMQFITAGDLSLHAAAVEVNGSALLLTGPGRFGKTTLAAAFLSASYRVLSEDLCRCRLESRPVVFPGPASLRMRHDAYARLGHLPDTRVVLRDRERVHLALEGRMRGDGQPLPIAAIVSLRVHDGPVRLQAMSKEEAMRDLWAMSLKLPTDEDWTRCFIGVSSVVRDVPVWRLTRPLSFAALPELVERLVTTCCV